MMLVTWTCRPPSRLAMLPQKFSAATTRITFPPLPLPLPSVSSLAAGEVVAQAASVAAARAAVAARRTVRVVRALRALWALWALRALPAGRRRGWREGRAGFMRATLIENDF